MDIKTRVMTNSGDKYLVCDLRSSYTELDLQNMLLQYKGIHLVFLKPSQKCDLKISTYDSGINSIGISIGAILCTVKYLSEELSERRRTIDVDNAHSLSITPDCINDTRVTLEIELPSFYEKNVVTNEKVIFEDRNIYLIRVFFGSPHVIIFCEELQSFPLAQLDRYMRVNGSISRETNIVAAHILDPAKMEIRIHHFGLGELTASGNAAVAAAMAFNKSRRTEKNVTVYCSGGHYHIKMHAVDSRITITGQTEEILR